MNQQSQSLTIILTLRASGVMTPHINRKYLLNYMNIEVAGMSRPTSEIVKNSILLLRQTSVHYFSMDLEAAIH